MSKKGKRAKRLGDRWYRAESYSERNAMVKMLGYSSYAEYLASDLWRSIRDQVLAGGKKCFRCGGRATQVHHGYYTLRNLAGKTTNGLLPACPWCHKLLEFGEDGTKLDPVTVGQRTGRVLEVDRGERVAVDLGQLSRSEQERMRLPRECHLPRSPRKPRKSRS